MRNITTRELDDLTGLITLLHRDLSTFYPRRKGKIWVFKIEYQEWIERLHRHYKPSARPYAWDTVLQVLREMFYLLHHYLQDQHPDQMAELRRRVGRQADRITVLEAENDNLRAGLRDAAAAQPQRATAVIPERQIEVGGKTRQAVLHLMGNYGLARSWRLVERVATMRGIVRQTVANTFKELVEQGLIQTYSYKGAEQGYRYKPRGRWRKLYTLSEDGRVWYRQAYGEEAVISELDVWAPKHHGVEHAVDILEARDLLRGLSLNVDDDPEPMLATDDRWGRRSEPDLLLYYEGHTWPVEVQREVHARNDAKWGKVLELSGGRLVLILESIAKMEEQAKLLRSAARSLPQGVVLLVSLEHLREADEIAWTKVITGTQR